MLEYYKEFFATATAVNGVSICALIATSINYIAADRAVKRLYTKIQNESQDSKKLLLEIEISELNSRIAMIHLIIFLSLVGSVWR